MVQTKLNVKVGTKFDFTAVIGTEEMTLKASCAKVAADKIWLTSPMSGGKSYYPTPGAAVVIAWDDGNHRFELAGTAGSIEKQGIRSYLCVSHKNMVKQIERRAHARIAVELPAEVASFDTASDGTRFRRAFPCIISDISVGGAAFFTDAPMAVGETVALTIARRGSKTIELRGGICWSRPAPRSAGMRNSTGLQFVFSNTDESAAVSKFVMTLAEKD